MALLLDIFSMISDNIIKLFHFIVSLCKEKYLNFKEILNLEFFPTGFVSYDDSNIIAKYVAEVWKLVASMKKDVARKMCSQIISQVVSNDLNQIL